MRAALRNEGATEGLFHGVSRPGLWYMRQWTSKADGDGRFASKRCIFDGRSDTQSAMLVTMWLVPDPDSPCAANAAVRSSGGGRVQIKTMVPRDVDEKFLLLSDCRAGGRKRREGRRKREQDVQKRRRRFRKL